VRNHQTTAVLKQILAQPSRHEPSLVASAARELSLRVQGEESLFERKVRLSAGAALVVGALCIVWSLLILALFPLSQAPEAPPSAPFVFRHFDAMFLSVGVFQAVVGLFLFLGGLLTRRRRPLGRILVLVALYLLVAYVVAFTTVMLLSGSGPIPFAFALFALVNAGVFGFLLWLPIRFFSSPRVRFYCRPVRPNHALQRTR
jgi:Kef-type K+ transport system membrane component KefB